MRGSRIQPLHSSFIITLGLTVFVGSSTLFGRADTPQLPAKPNGPWRAFGRVTDKNGKPLAGVTVSASCGYGTLFRTGSATSGNDGRYEMDFGPGIHMSGGEASLQAATISASLPGHFEANLNRQGNCTAAMKMPDAEQMKHWGAKKEHVFVPDRPIELNFIMYPAGRVSGKLVDEQGKPLAKYGVSLNGAELPPSSGVVCSTYADEQGRFTLEDIPTTYRFQLEVRKSDPKPPWDDSWVSAALRFEKPDKGDLQAWFGNREIRAQEFVLRVAGPGVHGRNATPLAGNVGVMNLTAAPTDIIERRDVLVVAKSATLTLQNTPKPDLTQSLITESVPAASAVPSKTRLTRTRANDAGDFTISFENPRGTELTKGKHQAIVRIFVGSPDKPDHQAILKQLDIQDGRYAVAVKVAPNQIDDTRVAITFVTIQPNHDAWVKAHFQDGTGPAYSGIWTGDGEVLPAIPFAQ